MICEMWQFPGPMILVTIHFSYSPESSQSKQRREDHIGTFSIPKDLFWWSFKSNPRPCKKLQINHNSSTSTNTTWDNTVKATTAMTTLTVTYHQSSGPGFNVNSTVKDCQISQLQSSKNCNIASPNYLTDESKSFQLSMYGITCVLLQ